MTNMITGGFNLWNGESLKDEKVLSGTAGVRVLTIHKIKRKYDHRSRGVTCYNSKLNK